MEENTIYCEGGKGERGLDAWSGGIHNALVTYSLYFCSCISVFVKLHFIIIVSLNMFCICVCICESCICISWQVELERGGKVWMLKKPLYG